ncbi:hypothetical protein L7F22_024208 [Adiantum nelumboides]|nr:hypothetical protein [Adiantum nelumboides]
MQYRVRLLGSVKSGESGSSGKCSRVSGFSSANHQASRFKPGRHTENDCESRLKFQLRSGKLQLSSLKQTEDWLHDLNVLNKHFQEETVDIANISTYIEVTLSSLRRKFLKEDFGKHTEYLKKFMSDVETGSWLYINESGVEYAHNLVYDNIPGKDKDGHYLDYGGGDVESCMQLAKSFVQTVIDCVNERFPDVYFFNAAKLFCPPYYPKDAKRTRSCAKRLWRVPNFQLSGLWRVSNRMKNGQVYGEYLNFQLSGLWRVPNFQLSGLWQVLNRMKIGLWRVPNRIRKLNYVRFMTIRLLFVISQSQVYGEDNDQVFIYAFYSLFMIGSFVSYMSNFPGDLALVCGRLEQTIPPCQLLDWLSMVSLYYMICVFLPWISYAKVDLATNTTFLTLITVQLSDPRTIYELRGPDASGTFLLYTNSSYMSPAPFNQRTSYVEMPWKEGEDIVTSQPGYKWYHQRIDENTGAPIGEPLPISPSAYWDIEPMKSSLNKQQGSAGLAPALDYSREAGTVYLTLAFGRLIAQSGDFQEIKDHNINNAIQGLYFASQSNNTVVAAAAEYLHSRLPSIIALQNGFFSANVDLKGVRYLIDSAAIHLPGMSLVCVVARDSMPEYLADD